MITMDTQGLYRHLKQSHEEMAEHIETITRKMRKFAKEADRIGDIPDQFWAGINIRMLNLDLVPLEYGGVGNMNTVLRRTLIGESLGYADPGLTLALPGPGLSMPPIVGIASEEQKQRIFKRFDSSTPRWGAFAITEPEVGSDATAIATTAVEDGDSYILNGEKCFITNGARADFVITFATLDKTKGRFGIRAFIVDTDTPGFEVNRKEDMLGVRASQLTTLSFVKCRVAKENMLGFQDGNIPRRDAFAGAQGAWDYMRPVLSSIIVGFCQSMLDYIRRYLTGNQLGPRYRGNRSWIKKQLQSAEHKVKAGRLLCYQAAWKFDQGLPMSKEASIAKSYVAQTAMTIARLLIEIAGPEGISKACIMEKWYRDAKAFDILEGTGDMQKLMITNLHLSKRHHRKSKRLVNTDSVSKAS